MLLDCFFASEYFINNAYFFCALAGQAQSGVLSPPLHSGHKGKNPFELSNRLK